MAEPLQPFDPRALYFGFQPPPPQRTTNARGQQRIGSRTGTPVNRGYQGGSLSPTQPSGLDQFYAMQNRALSGGQAAAVASMLAQGGMSLGRGGAITPTSGSGMPMGGDDFAARIAQRNMGGTTPSQIRQSMPRQQAPMGSISESMTASVVEPTPASQALPSAPAASPQAMNRQRLQEGAEGIRLLRQTMGTAPTMTFDMPSGTLARSDRFGSGTATFPAPGQPRPEATIEGVPAREWFQGAANRQGVANRFAQPQTMTASEATELRRRVGTARV